MNTVEQVVDWLYTEHFRVDEEWSYLLPTGFSWWADEYCQTVEMVDQETGPNGETGYLLCVRTDLLSDVDLSDETLKEFNALPMRCASTSGPVYDVEARRIDLWSIVRVTDDNADWMRYLLAAAAVSQLAEARMLAPLLATATGAKPAISEHPESGLRAVPDEIAYAAAVFVRTGDQPCAWSPAELDGIETAFPFGDETSEFRVIGDQPHPIYGNGLLLVQSFPVQRATETEGIRLALSLNAADLTREPAGYGLGSYSYADDAVHFSTFVPNALYQPGLLPNLCASAAARAQRMAARFVEGGWNPDIYSLDAAVLAHRRAQREAQAPAAEPIRGCPMMRAKAAGS